MRDIVVVALIIFSLWATIKHASWGALAWVFLSVSSFHQQGYATAGLPVAAVIAALLILVILFKKEGFQIPNQTPIVLLGLFTIWMTITYLASPSLDENYEMWSKVMKINIFTFVVLGVLRSREDIEKLIWIIVLALALTGSKGGIFTLTTGGGYRVWGPGGFIGGNNEFAVALVMLIPLMYYLKHQCNRLWVGRALLAGMVLCGIAALGSQSRGALLASAAMVLMMIMKGKRKAPMLLAVLLLIPPMIAFMPDEWTSRMSSIGSYEQDQSAMGRINAWEMAWNLAWDRPFGGGFENIKIEYFSKYASDTTYMQGAHSIYFQVMGQHGFIGFFLFIGIGISTWLSASRIKRHANVQPRDSLLASMIQVSMVGYAVGGAFLALAYFDVPYYLMIALVRILDLLEGKKEIIQPIISEESSRYRA